MMNSKQVVIMQLAINLSGGDKFSDRAQYMTHTLTSVQSLHCILKINNIANQCLE